MFLVLGGATTVVVTANMVVYFFTISGITHNIHEQVLLTLQVMVMI